MKVFLMLAVLMISSQSFAGSYKCKNGDERLSLNYHSDGVTAELSTVGTRHFETFEGPLPDDNIFYLVDTLGQKAMVEINTYERSCRALECPSQTVAELKYLGQKKYFNCSLK